MLCGKGDYPVCRTMFGGPGQEQALADCNLYGDVLMGECDKIPVELGTGDPPADFRGGEFKSCDASDGSRIQAQLHPYKRKDACKRKVPQILRLGTACFNLAPYRAALGNTAPAASVPGAESASSQTTRGKIALVADLNDELASALVFARLQTNHPDFEFEFLDINNEDDSGMALAKLRVDFEEIIAFFDAEKKKTKKGMAVYVFERERVPRKIEFVHGAELIASPEAAEGVARAPAAIVIYADEANGKSKLGIERLMKKYPGHAFFIVGKKDPETSGTYLAQMGVDFEEVLAVTEDRSAPPVTAYEFKAGVFQMKVAGKDMVRPTSVPSAPVPAAAPAPAPTPALAPALVVAAPAPAPATAAVAQPEPPKPADADGDGVPDRLDNCPTETGKINKPYYGCKQKQSISLAGEEIFLLSKIRFDRTNKLDDASLKILNQIAAVLKSHPEIKGVQIEDYTDNKGDEAKLTEGSQQRAEAVLSYLVNQGIQEARLNAVGFGPERPVQPNLTPRGREANRRVEFRIVVPKNFIKAEDLPVVKIVQTAANRGKAPEVPSSGDGAAIVAEVVPGAAAAPQGSGRQVARGLLATLPSSVASSGPDKAIAAARSATAGGPAASDTQAGATKAGVAAQVAEGKADVSQGAGKGAGVVKQGMSERAPEGRKVEIRESAASPERARAAVRVIEAGKTGGQTALDDLYNRISVAIFIIGDSTRFKDEIDKLIESAGRAFLAKDSAPPVPYFVDVAGATASVWDQFIEKGEREVLNNHYYSYQCKKLSPKKEDGRYNSAACKLKRMNRETQYTSSHAHLTIPQECKEPPRWECSFYNPVLLENPSTLVPAQSPAPPQSGSKAPSVSKEPNQSLLAGLSYTEATDRIMKKENDGSSCSYTILIDKYTGTGETCKTLKALDEGYGQAITNFNALIAGERLAAWRAAQGSKDAPTGKQCSYSASYSGGGSISITGNLGSKTCLHLKAADGFATRKEEILAKLVKERNELIEAKLKKENPLEVLPPPDTEGLPSLDLPPFPD